MQLRPMTMKDADFMLKLKNYSETRKFAIATHAVIKKKSHYTWLEKNIEYFNVIECDGKSVGAIRMQDDEISIWIDRKCRGKGIAARTLNWVSYPGLKAKIVAENIPSMKSFIRAGFEPVSFNGTYYIFQK